MQKGIIQYIKDNFRLRKKNVNLKVFFNIWGGIFTPFLWVHLNEHGKETQQLLITKIEYNN